MANWDRNPWYGAGETKCKVTRKQFMWKIKQRLIRAGDARGVEVDWKNFKIRSAEGAWVSWDDHYAAYAEAHIKSDVWKRRRVEQELIHAIWGTVHPAAQRPGGYSPKDLMYGAKWEGGEMK
ncbi:hypothetical protein [Lacipirellula parvula]|uniref:Uncharacterized protein n=1 Tax=Lacipirellula parvula TaxID=2650471 RepID=A0A5K7XDK8_9BACT|nr:hypothetical protein [Lacipirellula parvula]BBO31109.1 hypothetical protein PLANPX_0721 [Lacipirellula parvula]